MYMCVYTHTLIYMCVYIYTHTCNIYDHHYHPYCNNLPSLPASFMTWHIKYFVLKFIILVIAYFGLFITCKLCIVLLCDFFIISTIKMYKLD